METLWWPRARQESPCPSSEGSSSRRRGMHTATTRRRRRSGSPRIKKAPTAEYYTRMAFAPVVSIRVVKGLDEAILEHMQDGCSTPMPSSPVDRARDERFLARGRLELGDVEKRIDALADGYSMAWARDRHFHRKAARARAGRPEGLTAEEVTGARPRRGPQLSIGVRFGGTFDPVQNAHLAMAGVALRELCGSTRSSGSQTGAPGRAIATIRSHRPRTACRCSSSPYRRDRDTNRHPRARPGRHRLIPSIP